MEESSGISGVKALGKYSLIEKVSDGYLGPVYRSFDQDLGRSVEVLVFSEGIKWNGDLVEMFRSECETVAGLQHSNIASIFEVSTEGRFPYIAMEPLGNRSLRDLLNQETGLAFEPKISIMAQVAKGMKCAHENGVIHRNLCPENIYIAPDNSIKIRDFSFAHILMRHLPHPGVRWGAPIYLSPEQIHHQQGDKRSDIFALGIVFYELLTGVHPFYDHDSNKALDNILQNRMISTFEQYPEFHPRIWHILKICLAKGQEGRYADAGELFNAFRDLLNEIAEDVRLMLSELQASFASLKAAAELPDADSKTVRLHNDVWNILRGTDRPDYARLDVLISDLSEIYPGIRTCTVDHTAPAVNSSPFIQPDDSFMPSTEGSVPESETVSSRQDHGDNESQVEGAAAGTVPCGNIPEKADEGEDGMAEEEPGENVQSELFSDGKDGEPAVDCFSETWSEPAESFSEDLQETMIEESPAFRGTDVFSEETEPVSIPDPAFKTGNIEVQDSKKSVSSEPGSRTPLPRRKSRIAKAAYRVVTALILVLLIAVLIHTVRGNGAANILFGASKGFVLDSWETVKASLSEQPPVEAASGLPAGFAETMMNDSSSEYEMKLMDRLEATDLGGGSANPTEDRLSRIAAMIRSGDLQQAETELNRTQRIFPNAPEVAKLYRQLQDEMSRADQPQEFTGNARNETVLETEESRGTLTVLRLGEEGDILLDGQRIGTGGEIQDKMIPVGSHTVTVEKDGYLVASRSHDLNEGQTLALVYDLAQREVRPMAESDRKVLQQRREMEKTHLFFAEHSHGFLRGSCSGELAISYSEVSYRPTSGDHGFRIPFKILRLEHDGKDSAFYMISDNELFQRFKLDEVSAARLNRIWNMLKSLPAGR